MQNGYDSITPQQMRACEQYAVQHGVSLAELMDCAGYRLAQMVKALAYRRMTRKILVLCGNGNNGGDGFVCALALHQLFGIPARVLLVCGEPKTELAQNAFSSLRKFLTKRKEKEIFDTKQDDGKALLAETDILVDAVFGTGFHGDLPDPIREIFRIANATNAIKIACDLPSGVNALTGEVASETLACAQTLTFHAVKTGLLLPPARDLCGKIHVAEIGIPADAIPAQERIQTITPAFAATLLPSRPANGHKGTFGTAVLICGSERYAGAAVMSASAAMHAGCGLVKLFTTPRAAAAVRAAVPEVIVQDFPCDENGFLTEAALPEILQEAKTANAVLAGCGLGVTDFNQKLTEALLQFHKKPIILDADSINQLALNIDVLNSTMSDSEIILTPHPMELMRLMGWAKTRLAERLSAAQELVRKYSALTLFAKGAGSFLVNRSALRLSVFGDTALSKGGSGDLLAGLIVSLCAQGVAPADACTLASVLSGCTAERLSSQGNARAVTATQVIAHLSETFRALENMVLFKNPKGLVF